MRHILLHSNFVVAHQNLNSGLVELGVGLIPGWGGTKEMFLRSQGNKTKLLANLKNILFQNKSSSVDYFAIDYSVKTAINMNKNLILEQAFQEKFTNPSSNSNKIDLPEISLINEIDDSSFDKLQIDIMNFFQKIIDKKSVTEGELLDLEKEKFLQLASTPISLERISKFV